MMIMKPHELRARATKANAEAQKLYEDTRETGMSDEVAKRYDELLDARDKDMNDAAADEARWNRLQEMEEQQRAASKNGERLPVDGAEDLPHNDEKNTRK